jgi:hypothetical protein
MHYKHIHLSHEQQTNKQANKETSNRFTLSHKRYWTRGLP